MCIRDRANAGYLEIVESSIFDEIKMRKLFEHADICINLIGILFEKKGINTFSFSNFVYAFFWYYIDLKSSTTMFVFFV